MSYAGRLNGKPYWNCLCECGAMKKIMGQSLRQQKIVSCGAEHHRVRKGKVKPGARFGRLVVVDRETKNDWRCLCDCGKTITTRNTSLTSGHTTSCGCYARERQAAVNTSHGQSRTREYIALKARERLERKRALDANWTIEMDQALRQEQTECVVCGSEEHLSIDHVRPLSKGYGLAPGNAVVLCGSCNSAKFNKDLNQLPHDAAIKIASAAAAFASNWTLKE